MTVITSSLKNHYYCHHSVIFSSDFYEFLQICSFTTKIPTPPIPSLFPDKHSLYLLTRISTNRAPCPLHLTFCRQHIATFLPTVHALPYLFHKNFQHFNFQILPQISVTRRFFTPPTHLRAAGTEDQIFKELFHEISV